MIESKITIITLCWQRPKVFKAFLENHYNLVPRPTIVVAGSPDDNCEAIAKEYPNVIYIQRPNLPAGKKGNDACEAAKGISRYYMFTGSDDLMSQSMWTEFNKFEGDHLGLKDLYFYNLPTNELIYWKGYREGTFKHMMPIGAGKMVSDVLMEETGWRPYNDASQWPREFDTHMSFLKTGANLEVRTMAEMNGTCVDLKSEESITRFKLWPNSEFIDPSTIQNEDYYKYINGIIKTTNPC